MILSRIVISLLLILTFSACSSIAARDEFKLHAQPIVINLHLDADISESSRFFIFHHFSDVFIEKGYYIYPYFLTDYMQQNNISLSQRHAQLDVKISRDKESFQKNKVELYRYHLRLIDSKSGTRYWQKKGTFEIDYDCRFGKNINGGGNAGFGAILLVPFMIADYAVQCSKVEELIKKRYENYEIVHDNFYRMLDNIINEELREDLPLGPNYFAENVPVLKLNK